MVIRPLVSNYTTSPPICCMLIREREGGTGCVVCLGRDQPWIRCILTWCLLFTGDTHHIWDSRTTEYTSSTRDYSRGVRYVYVYIIYNNSLTATFTAQRALLLPVQSVKCCSVKALSCVGIRKYCYDVNKNF